MFIWITCALLFSECKRRGRDRERGGEDRGQEGGIRVGVGGQETDIVLYQQVCDLFYTCLIMFWTSNHEWKTLKPALNLQIVFTILWVLKKSKNYSLSEKKSFPQK